MNNMDERLNRSNRLPGSEKLTKPEEIGQLSKYLKSIKEVYEESTRLEDQVLGVTGYSTGKIPEINSLGDKTVKAPENQGETPDLSQKILGVPGKRWEEKLSEKRLNLKDPRTPELENEVIRTPDNHGGGIDHLGEVIKKIQDIRDQELEGKRIDLLDERQIALEDTRLNLQAMINPSLENKRIDLEDNRGVELEDKKVSLKDIRETELTNKRVDLEDRRNINLSDKILNLKKPEDVELENKRLDIQDEKITSLENKRVDISAEENIELRNKRIELKDDNKPSLSDKILNLKDEREIELRNKRIEIRDDNKPTLSDTRIDLKDERNLELGNKKIKIKDDNELSLSDKILNLKDEREIGLGNKRIKIEDNNEPILSDTRIDLKDERENQLRDKRLDIKDERNLELRDKRIEIEDNNEPILSDKILNLKDERENQLRDKRLNITDSRENQLENKRIDLKDDNEPILSDTRIDLKDEREDQLENKRLDIEDKRETSLSDKKIELEDEREIELRNKRIEIRDDNKPTLSDKILSLLDEREIELGDKRIELEDERENQLNDKKVNILENENGEPTELYDAFLGLPENENGEPEELYSQFLGIAENQNTTPDSLSNKILDIVGNQNTAPDSLSNKILEIAENQNKDVPDLSNVDSIKEYTSKLSDTELYEFAMGLASEGEGASGEHDGWMEKVGSLMSAYLSSDILTPKRAIEFRDAINNTLEMSYFGSQAALRVPVDTSSDTTWAKAEEAVGEQITGTNRRDALDEMIVKMVDYKRSNLPRIPGSDLVDAAKGAIKNVVGVVTGNTSHPNPMNKPLHMDGMAIPGGYGDTVYQAANNRTNFNTINEVGDVIGTAFYDRYWKAKSFKTTLEDLCPIVGKAPIASLTELKAILKSSPYFTSPGKFMTDTKGSYNTFSLDTNMYWEVTIEPFCCKSGPCSNGGYSFLPAIQEINYLNRELHGVSTNYGYWAPINSFELQKSKLSTKSLPLYEGEIAYPTGIEFTNELRLTFVDDAWKSWKRYFERCAEVAVYNSIAHDSSYYSASGVTRIDKTHICIASYKNLAFNIKIYILNPQLNIINRFNLLCVLKDYAEEYVGEIDSGGTDLNVTFSIVGENPEENKMKKFEAAAEAIVNLTQQTILGIQKRVTGAINSSVGLL